jgi:hypothetical protein
LWTKCVCDGIWTDDGYARKRKWTWIFTSQYLRYYNNNKTWDGLRFDGDRHIISTVFFMNWSKLNLLDTSKELLFTLSVNNFITFTLSAYYWPLLGQKPSLRIWTSEKTYFTCSCLQGRLVCCMAQILPPHGLSADWCMFTTANAIGTVNSTSDYTLWTLYRSYF